MPLVVNAAEQDGMHRWTAASCTCDLADENDELLVSTCNLLREAYGENELVAALENLDSDVGELFDLQALLLGFRAGLPNPAAESTKPKSLRNSRSEAAEMVARGGLKDVYEVECPTHPQEGKPNANIPFPGFDGWGLLLEDAGYYLVLIQVKASDEPACPPAVAEELAQECTEIPKDLGKLSRAIAIMAERLKETEYFGKLVLMLQGLSHGEIPPMRIAPVIVRGIVNGCLGDLAPVRARSAELSPAAALGLVITIGVDLSEFGQKVMNMARAA
ncbi:MAG: hypothetical protein ACREMZ_10090 [Gemmatimonadales bacterium]